MKETDYAIIQTEVQACLLAYPYISKEELDFEQLVAIVSNIYLNADGSKAVSNHVDNVCTIITTKKRMSLIYGRISTHFDSDYPIVAYEDLTTDIINILETLDICFMRVTDI